MNKLLIQTTSMRQDMAVGGAIVIGSLKQLVTHVKTRVKDTLSDWHSLAPMFLLIAIVSFSALAGYLLAQVESSGQSELVVIPASFSDGEVLSKDLLDESGKILRSAGAAVVDQTEMTNQLGQLRAELLRLHTVFAQLAQQAELDNGEFDLTSPLLDWHEQSSAEQIGLLKRRIAHMSASSQKMQTIFDVRRVAHDQRISGRPLLNGSKSSGFGYRKDPISGVLLEHRGLDFSGAVGEPILALADGIVTFSGKHPGYGNWVEIEHIDGLRTRYAHNEAVLVKSGARVKKGDAIAKLGSTGRSTGPHVHVEVRLDGVAIDPGFFIR